MPATMIPHLRWAGRASWLLQFPGQFHAPSAFAVIIPQEKEQELEVFQKGKKQGAKSKKFTVSLVEQSILSAFRNTAPQFLPQFL